MPTIVVPLEDIPMDPEDHVDLTALSGQAVIDRVKRMYGFLPKAAHISVSGGLVTIDLPEGSAGEREQALEAYERAGRAAERGRYREAIRMYQQALDVLPDHLGARRDLAMTYYELRESQAAKEHLLQILQLDPKDAWAYLIIGNLYAQFENDLDSAERFYQTARELSPDDVYVLTSYAGVKAKQGDLEEARSMFERAIESAPDYPNPRHGLALCYAKEDKPALAIAALEPLFEIPKSQDVRGDPVYEQARALYLDVNQQLAGERHSEIMARLEAETDAFSSETGSPIHVVQETGLSVPATTQLAWTYGRPYHTIQYSPTEPAILPHLVAHELAHIRLVYEARQADRERVFATTERTRNHALRYISSSVRKLERRGLSSQAINGFIDQMLEGLANQLFNIPIDMFIEHRVYHQQPFVRPSQVASLHATQGVNLRVLEDASIRDMTPNRIYRASVAMNCCYALYTDSLLGGATAYAERFRTSSEFATGSRLYRAWGKASSRFKPGDEYDLVDEFAQILKLEGWFEWLPEAPKGLHLELPPELHPDGSTNPELLKEKAPAAEMYCLSALRRFEGMPAPQIVQIASEIALLGRSGLDYASPDKRYTLISLPGESFSGLQLMCLMHVGFKRENPSVDPGTGLDDAYATALTMHQAKNH